MSPIANEGLENDSYELESCGIGAKGRNVVTRIPGKFEESMTTPIKILLSPSLS